MTAVDEIQAAIDKLTKLANSSPYIEVNGWLAEVTHGLSGAIEGSGCQAITNNPLTVTLHRTVDAQLGILRFVLSNSSYCDDAELLEVYAEQFALACSINGVTK